MEAWLQQALSRRDWIAMDELERCKFELHLCDHVDRQVYLHGVFEPLSLAMARKLIRRGMTIWDVGAHVGYFSLIFSKFAGSEGVVHAFEPRSSTLVRLRRNLELNANWHPKVHVHTHALSRMEGQLPFICTGSGNTGASHVAPVNVALDPGRELAGIEQTTTIPSRTGDSVWQELGRPKVQLVKLDIEGHELAAIEGMRLMLETVSPVILTELRENLLKAAGTSSNELVQYLHSLGYTPLDFDVNSNSFVRRTRQGDANLLAFFPKQYTFATPSHFSGY